MDDRLIEKAFFIVLYSCFLIAMATYMAGLEYECEGLRSENTRLEIQAEENKKILEDSTFSCSEMVKSVNSLASHNARLLKTVDRLSGGKEESEQAE